MKINYKINHVKSTIDDKLNKEFLKPEYSGNIDGRLFAIDRWFYDRCEELDTETGRKEHDWVPCFIDDETKKHAYDTWYLLDRIAKTMKPGETREITLRIEYDNEISEWDDDCRGIERFPDTENKIVINITRMEQKEDQ